MSKVGLGCSSFSTFFWSKEERRRLSQHSSWNSEDISRDNALVQEWVQTVQYAVRQAHISYIDTAPWYGHGTSEIVLGWAIEEMKMSGDFDRKSVKVNTKVGRYDADPRKMFDFSAKATKQSIRRSLERLKCDYIDVLQLHDPEFAVSLGQLMTETIPAMMEAKRNKQCLTLGLTGYPLSVQHRILECSMELYGHNIWDQSLTYCHYNLHDQTLFNQPLGLNDSFWKMCQDCNIAVLAAAPLSMGLLTRRGPADWHPAPAKLKQACREASAICQDNNVDISTLALFFALSNPKIPCTVLGMKSIEEVKSVHAVAERIRAATELGAVSQDEILRGALEEAEYKVLQRLLDLQTGPFASVSKEGQCQWDGITEAWRFWEEIGVDFEKWQPSN